MPSVSGEQEAEIEYHPRQQLHGAFQAEPVLPAAETRRNGREKLS